ncbi:MAG TPA: hypothetical protein VEC06_16240 [Paucimonas sp.]|nr:hypothetical protein [Paucimonas sp.]
MSNAVPFFALNPVTELPETITVPSLFACATGLVKSLNCSMLSKPNGYPRARTSGWTPSGRTKVGAGIDSRALPPGADAPWLVIAPLAACPVRAALGSSTAEAGLARVTALIGDSVELTPAPAAACVEAGCEPYWSLCDFANAAQPPAAGDDAAPPALGPIALKPGAP